MVFESVNGAQLPKRQKPNDVGLDAYVREDTVIPACTDKAVRIKVPLGFKVQLPTTVTLNAIVAGEAANGDAVTPKDLVITLPHLITVMHVNPRSGCSSKGMPGQDMVFVPTGEVKFYHIDGKLEEVQETKMVPSDTTDYGFDADVATGTVDPDYTGEVCATVISRHPHPWLIPAGTRICQCEIGFAYRATVVPGIVESNPNRTEGFGTSGI